MRNGIFFLMATSIVIICLGAGCQPNGQEGAKLTKEEVVELVGELESEVNNGGFDQFFFNSSGDKAADTIVALEQIGAKHTADIFRQAVSKFPGGMPSTNRFERQEQLEILSPDGDAFEAEDSAFYEYKDDIAALVAAFGG
jgi:hypothetical protein